MRRRKRRWVCRRGAPRYRSRRARFGCRHWPRPPHTRAAEVQVGKLLNAIQVREQRSDSHAPRASKRVSSPRQPQPPERPTLPPPILRFIIQLWGVVLVSFHQPGRWADNSYPLASPDARLPEQEDRRDTDGVRRGGCHRGGRHRRFGGGGGRGLHSSTLQVILSRF